MHEHGNHTDHGDGHPMPDPPGFHGMAVVGNSCIFLYHLSMADAPHNRQVVLHGSFGPSDAAYFDDKKAHPEARFHTFAPEKFVLPDLFPGDHGEPPERTSFTGTLFRHHFEQPPAHPDPPVEIASDVRAEVGDVVFHHRFAPDALRPEPLPYILFGSGPELFLAHRITGPFHPGAQQEFDQLLAVGLHGLRVSDDELRGGIAISVTGRPNTPGGRLREAEKAAAVAVVDGRDVPVEIDVESDLYFDTADLTPRPGHHHG
ncbi:hypothetical protein [Streptomyces bambusae]|uniref:Uncharacterized protein n=1 Tax=Streptomyces bambusae TaxID=1550616 RepID=A0ABS6Z6K2_9ACTN|nr:hypothetical protein [Streptomyces bambusae]MBW5483196.1 hypothetical protein [Streptomyces bambusae]